VSFTTVGYADLYPATAGARVAAALMMFMGLLALGTGSGVLASTFVEDRDAGETDEPGALDDSLGALHLLRAPSDQR
jgi:hypothetical protein